MEGGRVDLTEIDRWRALCSRCWFPGLAENCVKGEHQVRLQSVRTGNSKEVSQNEPFL